MSTRAPTSRVFSIDVLRGVALFGVLAVNIYDWLADPGSFADFAVQAGTLFLLENKVWPLFSFVFGLGFAIQLERARELNRPIFWAHARRMAVLYGFGLVLIGPLAGNPILVRYALLGALLLPFSRLSARHVLGAAAVALVGAVLARPIGATLITGNMDVFVSPRSIIYAAAMLEIFTMFLLGLYVGKRQVHQRLQGMRTQLLRMLVIGLSVGIVGTVVAQIMSDWTTLTLPLRVLSNFCRVVGGDLQSLGYAATIVLVASAHARGAMLQSLAFAGRMPLTNYLAQWLIMRLLFDVSLTGVGLSTGPSGGLMVATAIFIAQTIWSKWWFSQFSIGPAEWLWKSITYLSVQQIRRVRVA